MEFLCTLGTTDNGVEFRLFGKEFTPTWKDLSLLLGFDSCCAVDFDSILQDFDRSRFWKDISGKTEFEYPKTNDIHNPTLRFMHRWFGMSLFPRFDTRTARIDYLKLLYAMIKRKVSPVKCMMYQWLEVFSRTANIECTSLVTRIASNLGLLANASILYISELRSLISNIFTNLIC